MTTFATTTILAACGEDDGGEAAAIVNGEEIPQSEIDFQLEQMEQMYAQQGMDMDDPQLEEMFAGMDEMIVEEMVTQELLVQEAENADISISDEEIESQLEQVRSQFGSEEEFEEALEMDNITVEDLEEDIKTQLAIESLLEPESLAERDIDVSEEELEAQYEMMEMQNPEVGDFEEVKPELEQQVQQQQLIEQLHEESDIEILI